MLQTFQYQNSPITFSKDGEVMINATQMAKPFSKETTEFLSNQQSKNFIDVLEAKLGIPSLKIQRGGANPGTWMHQKLALKFAGWLSPEFELWVYDRIEELLTTGKTEIAPMNPAEMKLQVFRMLEEEAESLRQQNFLLSSANEILEVEKEELTSKVKFLKPKSDLFDAMHECTNKYTTDSIANELGIKSAQEFHKMLKRDGIIKKDINGNKWALCSKYRGLDLTKDYPHYIPLPDGTTKIKMHMYWTGPGRIWLHQKYNPKALAS